MLRKKWKELYPAALLLALIATWGFASAGSPELVAPDWSAGLNPPAVERSCKNPWAANKLFCEEPRNLAFAPRLAEKQSEQQRQYRR